MKKLIYLLFLVVLVSGCGTIPKKINQPIIKSRTFNASFVNAWEATVQVLSKEIIMVAEKDSGLISFKKNTNIPMWKKYALIPKRNYWGFRAAPEITVTVLVKDENENNTNITIHSKIVNTVLYGLGAFAKAEFSSNGLLEKEYLDEIQEQLN